MKWGKFGSFYSCSNYTKTKPKTIAVASFKKDPKAVVKRIKDAVDYPFQVKGMIDDAEASNDEVTATRNCWRLSRWPRRVARASWSTR